MKKLSCRLVLGLWLLLILASPVVLYADQTVYVDTTGTLTKDSSQPEGSQMNPVPNLNRGLALMANQSGMIIFIYSGGLGTQFCEMPVTNGAWTGVFRNCKQGIPPGTGEPVAPVLWGALGGIGAIVLIAAGLLLRKRGSPVRTAV